MNKARETLHKARLTALHAIYLQIFRHIAQKSLAIHQVCLRNFCAICRKIWLRILRTSFMQCFPCMMFSLQKKEGIT